MPKRPPNSREASTSGPLADLLRPGLSARAIVLVLRLYRLLLSPLLPPVCRFAPSCSAFAIEAVEQHGARRGLVIAVGRVLRCHPWHAGGYDPVPRVEA